MPSLHFTRASFLVLIILYLPLLRTVLRKAALFAADESDDMIVEDRHIEEALRELVFEGGELTKRLLGASRAF